MTKDIYLNSYLSKEQNDALLEDHSNLVVLTPDDIITMKLLRDEWLRMATIDQQIYQPALRRSDIRETLERILKQIQ